MNNSYRASICIPTYQMGDVIGKCLASLINATSETIEIVIVDDGSSDNTSSVCTEFATNNERVNYYKLKRSSLRKLGFTRNIAATFAQSNILILHIDADDLWPESLQKLIDFYLYLYKLSLTNHLAIIGHHFAIIDKNTYWHSDGYDNLYRGEDREFMFRLANFKNLYFLDHSPIHTRMKRSNTIIKKKTFKDLWSQSKYDVLCTDSLLKTLIDSLLFSFANKSYSIKAKVLRFFFVPACCIIYSTQRKSIQKNRPIDWNSFISYKKKRIGDAYELIDMISKPTSVPRDINYEKTLAKEPFDKKQNLTGFSL